MGKWVIWEKHFYVMTGEHCFCQWWKGDMHSRDEELRERNYRDHRNTLAPFNFLIFTLCPVGLSARPQEENLFALKSTSCPKWLHCVHHLWGVEWCCTLMTFIKTCNGSTVGDWIWKSRRVRENRSSSDQGKNALLLRRHTAKSILNLVGARVYREQ